MLNNTKVVFMGTPEFAACSLRELINNNINVVGVFTNPDKPAGRGMKVTMSPVKQCALENNIKVFQPQKIRNNNDVVETLKELNPDVIVVVAYGKILPKEILDLPRLGAINVHGSLLPKYRGAAPIQWAVINGEKTTGITTMFMDAGMDTGDMLLKKEIAIEEDDDFEKVHDKLKIVGAKLLIETLEKVVNNTIVPVKQPEEFTLAPMIEKEMTKIDFSKNVESIYNFVRGLSPFPGTYMEFENGSKYKVYKVEKILNESVDVPLTKNIMQNGEIAYVSKDKLYIKCENGYVSIIEIQPANSKRMNISSFLAGNKLEIGQKCV